MTMSIVSKLDRQFNRVRTLDELRLLLPKLEGLGSGQRGLVFRLPAIDAHLPQGGLMIGALHEIVPKTASDFGAALGFAVALLIHMPRQGPIVFVRSPDGLGDWGLPYGHGFASLGLDPGRLLLVEAGDETLAAWAMEEALGSGASAAVLGATAVPLDLKTSRRLHLAARKARRPLILLRPVEVTGASATVSRWRVGAAPAAHDRFGVFSRWRWRVTLARCRNGRPGEWLLEWDHVSFRFSLAAAMADPACPGGYASRSWLS